MSRLAWDRLWRWLLFGFAMMTMIFVLGACLGLIMAFFVQLIGAQS